MEVHVCLYKWPAGVDETGAKLAYPKLVVNHPTDGHVTPRTCVTYVSMSRERSTGRRDEGVALDRPIGGCDVALSVRTIPNR
uniref:Uncharacterized protein n=1 Tax=Arundo donax TaxID=35708 RepID=A0A0A9CB89_ARUDO